MHAFRDKSLVIRIILVLIVVVTASIGTSLYLLYSLSMEQLGIRLQDFARTEARFLENIAVLNELNNPTKDKAVTIRRTFGILDKVQFEISGFGETGEFTVARVEGDSVVYYLNHRLKNMGLPAPIKLGTNFGEPMQKVLRERKGGVMIGRDYRGTMVLSAFEPSQYENFGVVAKIDLSEVRRPYIYAGIRGILLSIVFVVAGSGLIVKIGNRIIFKLAKTNALLGKEIQDRRAAEDEVRRANEELETTNEEMSSTLEELDRSQEELLHNYNELQESNQKFRLSFENSNVGMCLVDITGKFIHVNKMMSVILGYTNEELEKMTIVDVTFPDDLEASLQFLTKGVADKIGCSTIEKRYFHKDGHRAGACYYFFCKRFRDSSGIFYWTGS